jgi:hypothetical protein
LSNTADVIGPEGHGGNNEETWNFAEKRNECKSDIAIEIFNEL